MTLAAVPFEPFTPGAWLSRRAQSPLAVFTTQQVRVVDALSPQSGVSTDKLMSRAGSMVAEEIKKRYSRRQVMVLCGPGNNGGDGLVAAAELKHAGWTVNVMMTVGREELKGDAALAIKRWEGPVSPITVPGLEGTELVIDALFGAGLNRNISPEMQLLFEGVAKKGVPVIAIDIPSGIEGNSGRVMGSAMKANVTIALARKKPGHLLLPGRAHCGEVVVVDIGIPPSAYEVIQPNLFENAPMLWADQFPQPDWPDHKYSRGCVLVAGGAMTGAARLAARGAQRAGAGAVQVAASGDLADLYSLALTSCVIRSEEFALVLADKKHSAVLIGPGYGVNKITRQRVLDVLKRGKPTVLDADALTCFEDKPEALIDALHADVVLTPHEGEFTKLFAFTGDALRRASLAAVATGVIVVLKGAATVVAAPDGSCVINTNAPPDLATAGSGDVLAGIITGLMAQGMRPFPAAAAGVWLHGEAARRFGPGLIAEDIELQLPAILKEFRASAA